MASRLHDEGALKRLLDRLQLPHIECAAPTREHVTMHVPTSSAPALRLLLSESARARAHRCYAPTTPSSEASSDHQQHSTQAASDASPLVACARHKAVSVFGELESLETHEAAALQQLTANRDAVLAEVREAAATANGPGGYSSLSGAAGVVGAKVQQVAEFRAAVEAEAEAVFVARVAELVAGATAKRASLEAALCAADTALEAALVTTAVLLEVRSPLLAPAPPSLPQNYAFPFPP